MLVQLGPLISDAAGSFAGCTIQRGPLGHTVRKRPLPTLRRNAFTNPRRELLQFLSRNWAGLTAGERTAWQTAADALTWTNKFGTVIRGLGYWLYIRCNQYRNINGQALITVAPAVGAVTAITGLASASNVAGGTMTVSWTSGNVNAAETWEVYATRAVSIGRTGPRSQSRFITTIAAGTASGVSISVAWKTKFGAALPTSRQTVFVTILPMLTTIGAIGAPQRVAMVCT